MALKINYFDNFNLIIILKTMDFRFCYKKFTAGEKILKRQINDAVAVAPWLRNGNGAPSPARWRAVREQRKGPFFPKSSAFPRLMAVWDAPGCKAFFCGFNWLAVGDPEWVVWPFGGLQPPG